MNESLAAANKRHMDAVEVAIENAREVVIDSMPGSREQSIVMTKLDEALMWARKGLSN